MSRDQRMRLQLIARGPAPGSDPSGEPACPVALQWLLFALLLVKLAITAWNCFAFDGLTYDQNGLALPRARGAGLSLDGRAYNPPLYYLPVLPLVPMERWLPGRATAAGASKSADVADDDSDDAPGSTAAHTSSKHGKAPQPRWPRATAEDLHLLAVLRWTNLLHLTVFYVCWIYGIFAAVLGRGYRWAAASLLLLALPAFQKVAAMTHPDNALASFSALTIVIGLVMRRRILENDGAQQRGFDRGDAFVLFALAVCGGLTGLTRPFGVLVSAATCVVITLVVARRNGWFTAAFFQWALPLCVVAVLLATAWQTYQIAVQGELAPVTSSQSEKHYEPYRKHFDRVHFFSSFYIKALLEEPNRTMNRFDRKSPAPKNRYGNSFFTMAYSELWGDHWLLFTSPSRTETKLWPKRVILTAALPLVPLFLWRFGRGVALAASDVRRRVPGRIDTSAFLLLFLLLGAALYLLWQQGGGGLSPGKNSGVKFIYVAYLAPFPIALAFMPALSGKRALLWLSYIGLLFVLALPIAIW